MSDLTNYVSSTKEPQPVVLLLSEIAYIVMGQSPGAETYCDLEDGIPFLQGCSEFGGFHPRPEIGCNPPLRVGRAGSVLISVRAPVGTMNFADQDYCIGRGLAAIYPKNGKSNRVFIKYAVENSLDFLYRRSQGSTFLAVSSADIKGIPLPNFTLIHQQKIATILTTIDTAIEKTEALIEKYQQIKAGLMHDLFTRGVLPNGQLRPSFEQAPELYQKTVLGWIPKEWDIKKLGALAHIVSGVTLGGNPRPDENIQAPYLRVANVQDGFLDLSEIKTVMVSQKAFEHLRLKQGDVLMNEGGDYDKLGRGAVWENEIDGCIHQNHVFRVRTNKEMLSHYFLAFFTESYFGKKYFLLNSKQSTNLASINSTQLHAYPVLLPELEEQKRIEDRIASIKQRINTLRCESDKYTRKKLGLMQDLLTGKVPVTVDQPAEASNA
jgi:type I restriction enzyme, S subunit